MLRQLKHIYCVFFILALCLGPLSLLADTAADKRQELVAAEDAVIAVLEKHGLKSDEIKLTREYSKGEAFAYPENSSVDDKIKQAKHLLSSINSTKNLRSFSNIDNIFFIDRKGPSDLVETNILFPSQEDPREWLSILSESPKKEPLYVAYLEEQKQKQRKKHLTHLKEFETYYDLSQDLCEARKKGTALKELAAMVTKKLGREITVEIKKNNAVFAMASGSPEQLVWSSASDFHCFTYYENKFVLGAAKRRILGPDFKACMQADTCKHFLFKVAEKRVGEENPKHSIRRRLALNGEGEIEEEVFLDQPVQPLEEIYGVCTPNGTELSKPALELTKQTDRIVIGVIDQGIDYNHTSLAAYTRRRENPKIKDLELLANAAKNELDAYNNFLLKHSETPMGKLMEAKYPSILNKFKKAKKDLTRLRKEFPLTVGLDLVGDYGVPYDYGTSLEAEEAFIFNHGTGVASMILSASQDVVIEPVRVNNLIENLDQGVDYLAQAGARVINVSLTTDREDEWNAFRNRVKKYPEIIFVVAAGNHEENLDNPTVVRYPAKFPEKNIVVVASVDKQGKLAKTSSYGKMHVDLGARGVDVRVDCPEQKYCTTGGTSLASPYVAGVIGAMVKANPKLKRDQILQILKETVDHTPELEGKTQFGGIVNRDRAVARARQL